MLGVVLPSHTAKADYYLTFRDGRLYVFPSACYKRLTRNANEISFTAKDDVVYTYSLRDIKSIDVQLPKELPDFTSFKFNNKYNYQVYTDAVGTITDDEVSIEVGGIGKRLTASFTLSDEMARAYVDGKEQESKVSRLRFENSRNYVVGYPGDLILTQIEVGKYAMMPFGHTYSVNVHFLTDHSTSVPRIDINTVGGVNILNKEDYVDAEIIIDGAGVFPSMTDSVQIRGRGNDAWSTEPNAKNPYRLKFAEKVKPFGLTKGKNWVLLSNTRKGSMLTNAFGMKATSLIETVAPNHIIPVDLYLNGRYKGSYNFTEKVGLSNNSVDLDDETIAALLELDLYYDEIDGQKFESTPYNLPVNIKHPDFGDDETVLTLDMIQERFNSFVSDVYNGDDFSEHVDIDQLARYLMVSEFICNIEMFHPKSVFCYYENLLDDSSKLVFGPLWDLDWAFGYYRARPENYFNYFTTSDYYTIYSDLEQYDFFVALRNGAGVSRRLYELWKEFYGEKLDELCEFCQDYYKYARPSLDKNRSLHADDTDYAAQTALAIKWFRQRADYIFDRLKLENWLPGDVNDDGIVDIDDMVKLVDYLLLDSTTIIREDNSDVDGDGEITIEDLSLMIDIFSNS